MLFEVTQNSNPKEAEWIYMVTFSQTEYQIKTGHVPVVSSINVIDLINMQIKMVTQGLQKYSVKTWNLNVQDY